MADPASILRRHGTVRFEAGTGSLYLGATYLGDLPRGTKEFYLLACLAEQQDCFVPYADLKRYVVQQAGSQDTTEEATFCHKLKRRIKAKWIPRIDALVVTNNKADGYRLRGRVEAW